jgi:CubicO group peptidase (beta-lactamase class C family)
MKKLVLLAVLVAASCGAAGASLLPTDIGRRPSGVDQSAAIDTLFAPWTAKDSPGCAVGVFKDGAMQYARGYGMASLEHDAPIAPESVFYAGSVSKQFTAFAAALAIKQGKLAYEDAIRKYLPELPAYADAIRVRHLLHHTSGLRDYNALLAMAGRRDEDAWDNRAVLRITARQKGLNFEPGAEYLYSNTGYTLLATIVERATGTPFATYADTQIFTPLGMRASHFHTDARRLVPRRALGYGGRGGAWTLDTPINERAGAGGLYTTIPDLLKWDENFYTGKVGGRDLIAQLQRPGRLNDGTTQRYAWGLQIGEYRGMPIVEHSGSLGGYRAHLLRIPSQHASVALLCNASSIAPTMLTRRVADAVLGSAFEEAAPPVNGAVPADPSRPSAPTFAPDAIRSAAGTFYSEELEAEFTIGSRDGMLTLVRPTDPEPFALEPGSRPDELRGRGGLTLRFRTDASGRVTSFTTGAGRVRGIVFVRK